MNLTTSPYRTVNQFVAENPAFTKGGIRFEIFNETTNGLKEAGAIIRNGRKVLVHVPRYFQWLDAKNGIDTDVFDAEKSAI